MKHGRKITGGKYKKQKKKKSYELARQQRIIKIGETKKKKIKAFGGNQKITLLQANEANIFNPKTKKTQKTKIKNVLETPANKFWARQNILIKSAIIETELGKAKITNRPSQEGSVQGVLIEE